MWVEKYESIWLTQVDKLTQCSNRKWQLRLVQSWRRDEYTIAIDTVVTKITK